MIEVLIRVLPFFALIGVGYIAGRTGFLSAQGTAAITRFVFYFALSAMLFKFASNLSLAEIYSTPFVLAYLSGCTLVYLLAFGVAAHNRQQRFRVAGRTDAHQLALIGDMQRVQSQQLTGRRHLGPHRDGAFIQHHADVRRIRQFVKRGRKTAPRGITQQGNVRHRRHHVGDHMVERGAVRLDARSKIQPLPLRQDCYAMVPDRARDQHNLPPR